ncbi:MAG: hypothetical protein JWL77_2562, partial [Chthonomonadaceae bacterium]|nr:hypothetical protein [Chthonomonadaceae bacterium]
KTDRTKPHNHDNDNELARLRRENARLQHKLEKAELIIDVQKKGWRAKVLG